MTGQHLLYSKHAVIEFSAYVQTHEEHSKKMDQHTMGCMCLGPTGNQQGGHWFMSLTSGERVIRYRWTELPVPQEAINWVSSIGRRQGMPSLITYVNRHGCEIGNTVADYPEDNQEDDDDETYKNSDQSDDELDEYDESSTDDSSSSDSSDDDMMMMEQSDQSELVRELTISCQYLNLRSTPMALIQPLP
jgi:hypothetical protein